MGKSNAKKYREKLAREGKRNPEVDRSPFAKADMRTRRTKTKKDYLYRAKYKNHDSSNEKNGFFYAQFHIA
ncbi:hypothetical protein WAK64_13140 [Bacillus spongiae]|uniref:YfhE family protein n=1 Tax=Bacillus spongiae TaxID=2683610 RepID=A0ABU8HFG0_9BACI